MNTTMTSPDRYYTRLVGAPSVEVVADLMAERFRDHLGRDVQVDLTGGDLKKAQFVAAGADQWGRFHADDERLTSFRISNEMGDPESIGGAYPTGEVVLNRAYFGGQPTRTLPPVVTQLALAHHIDEVPAHAALLITLHELAHITGYGMSRYYSGDFLPNLTDTDQRCEENWFQTEILPRVREANPKDAARRDTERLLLDLNDQAFERARLLETTPELRALQDEATMVLHVGPNGRRNKREAFVDACVQGVVAGFASSRGARALWSLGGSCTAMAADAGSFVARLRYLGTSVGVWAGSDRPSAQLSKDREDSRLRAGLPLGPGPLRGAAARVLTELREFLPAGPSGIRQTRGTESFADTGSVGSSPAPGETAASVPEGARVPVSAGLRPVPRGAGVSRTRGPVGRSPRGVARAAAVARGAAAQTGVPVLPRCAAQAAVLGRGVVSDGGRRGATAGSGGAAPAAVPVAFGFREAAVGAAGRALDMGP